MSLTLLYQFLTRMNTLRELSTQLRHLKTERVDDNPIGILGAFQLHYIHLQVLLVFFMHNDESVQRLDLLLEQGHVFLHGLVISIRQCQLVLLTLQYLPMKLNFRTATLEFSIGFDQFALY